jgi:hypothetical protein
MRERALVQYASAWDSVSEFQAFRGSAAAAAGTDDATPLLLLPPPPLLLLSRFCK